MKIKIRRGVFETNSSSTHSITICSDEEFENWKKGLLYFDRSSGKFVPACPKKEKKDDYETYIDFMYEGDLETYEDTYTTKNGEQIVVFGYFGYNG